MDSLPSYVLAAKPIPRACRTPWYTNIAPTYAGVLAWFIFWQSIVGAGGTSGGVLATGLGTALAGLVIAALICHFLCYLVPGRLGVETGLPLYVVGTSTYGTSGGYFMPGLLMGILQFCWLGVSVFAVAAILCKCFGIGLQADGEPLVPGPVHGSIAVVFGALAVVVGQKGMRYVGRVATYLPVIPVVVLVVLFAKTAGGLPGFRPAQLLAGTEPAPASPATAANAWNVVAMLVTYVVGFFATAGAAGVDLGMNARNTRDIQLAGLFGIVIATVFSGGMAILIVAGAYGAGLVPASVAGQLNPIDLMKTSLLPGGVANVFMILLAISSFAPACAASFVAANSFRTAMPKLRPVASVGIGGLLAIILAVSGWAGEVVKVFEVVGASFGPVCGAMAADYLRSKRKWAGPRAGFNPAGWISWAAGFVVGAFNLLADMVPLLNDYSAVVPVPPLTALVVGFVVYYALAEIGLESRRLEVLVAG